MACRGWAHAIQRYLAQHGTARSGVGMARLYHSLAWHAMARLATIATRHARMLARDELLLTAGHDMGHYCSMHSQTSCFCVVAACLPVLQTSRTQSTIGSADGRRSLWMNGGGSAGQASSGKQSNTSSKSMKFRKGVLQTRPTVFWNFHICFPKTLQYPKAWLYLFSNHQINVR